LRGSQTWDARGGLTSGYHRKVLAPGRLWPSTRFPKRAGVSRGNNAESRRAGIPYP
jgi:hypothetical protein